MAAAAAPRAIVIGGGLAGCTAALSAALAAPHVQVLLLDKERQLGGNSAWANSGINALSPETGDSADAFKADTLRSGGGRCRQELVEALVDRSPAALAFLQGELGVDLSCVTQLGGLSRARTRAPPPSAPPVGAAIMGALEAAVARQPNLQVRTGAHVMCLAPEPGGGGAWRVRAAAAGEGLDGGGEQELAAWAVVLATGGYAASQRLLARWCPAAAGLGTTNGPWASGEGAELGASVGAELLDMDQVQLNPTAIVDPLDPGAPTKTVAPERLRGLGAVLLGPTDGKRFVNELGPRDEVAGAILRQPVRQALLLFGSATAEVFGMAALEPLLAAGLLWRAGSATEFENGAGLPAGAVRAELAAYAAAVAEGCDAFGKTTFPAPADPDQLLYYCRVAPAAHYCMGGIAIDAAARVLAPSGRPLLGLFAAGEVTGGIHGKNLLVGSSLLDCVVFGRAAGESAAAHAAVTARS